MSLYGKLTILCKCKTVIYMQVYNARLKLDIYAKNTAESYIFLANKKSKQCMCRLVLQLPKQRQLKQISTAKSNNNLPICKVNYAIEWCKRTNMTRDRLQNRTKANAHAKKH